jgi:4-hydroxy-tetrahydrodipicolinate synthase
VRELVTAFREGDVTRAEALEAELRPAIELLRVVTNPIAIKHALSLLGLAADHVRLPLVPVTASESAAIRRCLERLDLLAPAAA